MAAIDNVLYVDSSSIAALFATGSLFGTASNAVSASWAPSGANGTTLVTASTYQVTASWANNTLASNTAAVATSASFASASISSNTSTSASFSQTASYFNIFPKLKAGVIASNAFSSSGGNPWTASITFTTAYPTSNYSVTVTGADARPWTVEQLSASNFTISTNSTQALTANVYWQSMAVGESA